MLNPPRSGSPIGSCLDERVDQMTPVPNLGRRAFLAGTTGIAAASLIGCAGNEPTSTPDSGSAGGSIEQFTAAFQGNSTSEGLDPGIHTAFIDEARPVRHVTTIWLAYTSSDSSSRS